jgi:hypothetical protein
MEKNPETKAAIKPASNGRLFILPKVSALNARV